MRLLLLALLAPLACAAPASAADPSKGEPARMNIDVSAADATAQWDRAVALLARCAPLDVAIWYPLGSAKVHAEPEKGGCRVDLETEIEGDRRRTTCVLPAGTPWEWNLVADGGKARQAPPRDPPPALAARCKR